MTFFKQKIFSPAGILMILVGIISFALYANTLTNGYALDDFSLLQDNSIINKGIAGIGELLTTPYLHGKYLLDNDLYRPISLITYAVQYHLFGDNTIAGHLINVLLFAGCALILFTFLHSLFEKKRLVVAFVAALLFALHPIHTEVVANLKSRDELLCFLFGFLALHLFVQYTRNGGVLYFITASLCYTVSLFSKETSITLLAVIPLVLFFYCGSKGRAAWATVAAFVCAGIYLLARHRVLGMYHADHIASIGFVENALTSPLLSFGSRIATAIYMLGYYIRLLVVPYPLICDYSYKTIPFAHFGDWSVWLTVVTYISLASVGIYRLVAKQKDPVAFAILFFLITISLFSNILFFLGATMGERFLFFPSVGFCVVVAVCIDRLATGKGTIIIIACATIGLVYSILALRRNSEWADNYTLFNADLKKAPDNCRLNFYLASEILQPAPGDNAHADYATAIACLYKAVTVYPQYSSALGLLGVVYEQGYGVVADTAQAIQWYTRSAQQGNVVSANSLGKLYFRGYNRQPPDYAMAVKWLKEAAKGDDPLAEYVLGQIYAAGAGEVKQDYAAAAKWYALAAAQGHLKATGKLGILYYEGKGVAQDKAKGAVMLHKAADAGLPEFSEYLNNHSIP